MPWNYIAFKFCTVKFSGFRAEEMREKWRDIENRRYALFETRYRETENKIKELRGQAHDLYKQAKESRPFYRFWYIGEERDLRSKAKKILAQVDDLEKENEKNEERRFFDVYERRRRIEELLQDNGFVLTSASSRGTDCVTNIEIWTLEE